MPTSTPRTPGAGSSTWAAALLVPLLAGAAAPHGGQGSFTFAVTYTPDVHPGSISARVYVMLVEPGDRKEPRRYDDWFHPRPVLAVGARDRRPGEPFRIGPGASGTPGPLESLPQGSTWIAQAIVRLNPDTRAIGDGPVNGYTRSVRITLDHDAGGTAALTIDRIVAPRRFKEIGRIRLVEVPSPLLSRFHRRPVRHRAAVILHEGNPSRRRPTLYIAPSPGGDHTMAKKVTRDPRFAFGRDMICVVLDPDCGTGHHAFADSTSNGPRGRALVEELIPYFEDTFHALPDPSARLLNGHSSGGWSAPCLQVTYPDTFGGAWTTGPDSVDFRDFQRVDLDEPGANLYRDPAGDRRPIARQGTSPVLSFDDFAHREDVLGDGGQLGSFEAAFSPPGPDGRPRPLWDRTTGAVNPKVARSWGRYDIRLVLEGNWATLDPRLAGKLHVFADSLDTFYLEGAVKPLGESLAGIGGGAVVEVVPGKDHFSLIDRALAACFDREMREAVGSKDDAPSLPTR